MRRASLSNTIWWRPVTGGTSASDWRQIDSMIDGGTAGTRRPGNQRILHATVTTRPRACRRAHARSSATYQRDLWATVHALRLILLARLSDLVYNRPDSFSISSIQVP